MNIQKLSHFYSVQVYLVFRNGGKSLEDTLHNKSTAAKFISRSQPRTYASASSVNVSTGQLHYPNGKYSFLGTKIIVVDCDFSTFLLLHTGADNRLSENEAVEEIKQLAKQLQNLYDRIPQRGPATNVILTLLDICRTAQTTSVGGALTLKPPSQPHEQAPAYKLSICNGSGYGGGVDKETNTSFDNLVKQQLNDISCRSMISDKCDNDNHLGVKDEASHTIKLCEANNKTTTITCSSNSLNFDNLKLQCMCSSDNNSPDEFQIENCDNCSSNHQCESQPSGSFRERLLNFTSSNTRQDETRGNNLRKRNSELVLGTNFEATQTCGGDYKSCQSYRISCENIFSNKPPAVKSLSSENSNTNKSNHSLSTESDHRTQIPYSFLERPTMKLSQSEDRNLRELKIALSSTLPSANKTNNSNINKSQLICNLKSSQTVTQQSQSYTSSSSTSSKVDKISFSLSASSTSDALHSGSKKLERHQNILTNAESSEAADDEIDKQRVAENIDNDNENDDKIIETVMVDNDDSNSTNINNANNGNGKKRKTPESKLAIDLNDRSKYTEEVSV